MSLNGKTLFITGASRGIGLAIALRAARDGANIAIAAKTVKPDPRLPGTIFSAAEEIEKAGGKALPLACDIRDEQSVEKAVAETVAKLSARFDAEVAAQAKRARAAATEARRRDARIREIEAQLLRVTTLLGALEQRLVALEQAIVVATARLGGPRR